MEPLPSDPSPGGVLPYQWVSRRLAMGGYAQDESVSKMHFVEMEPGVHLVSGRPHNALVVELAKSLVVIDAPFDEAYSRWTIDACKVKFPGKRIEALVITHHHNDHSGGARAYVAEGAIVVVGAPSRAHFERMFKAPHVIDGDSLQRRPRAATIVEVTDEYLIKDAKRPLRLVRIKNDHAQGMLFLPARLRRRPLEPGPGQDGVCANLRPTPRSGGGAARDQSDPEEDRRWARRHRQLC